MSEVLAIVLGVCSILISVMALVIRHLDAGPLPPLVNNHIEPLKPGTYEVRAGLNNELRGTFTIPEPPRHEQ